jgi:hypothetical protein
MKANYKNIDKPATSEVTLGNLYDMNKQIMEQIPVITDEEIAEHKDTMTKWFFDKINQKYFMLLCHEQRDYTLFNLDGLQTCSSLKDKCMTAADDVIDCMNNRGIITAITLQEDGAYEIWMRNTEGNFAYYLFPYGAAVLEY